MSLKMIFQGCKSLVFLMAFVISGCVINYATVSPDKVKEAVSISSITEKNMLHYVGPTVLKEETYDFTIDYNYYHLQSWRDLKTNALKHQFNVRIANTTGKYRTYTSARFDNDLQADLTELRRYERCRAPGGRGGKGGFTECFNEQTLGIALTEDFLKTHALRGFFLNVDAENGHQSRIHLTSNYIQGYLEALKITVP